MSDEQRLRIFWAIEKKDLHELEAVCKEMQEANQDFGMYFQCKMWDEVFGKYDAETIKVYLCGSVDFAPIQHAYSLDWLAGCKCLLKYNIGCTIQGCGLQIVGKEFQQAIKNIPLDYE